MFHRDDSGWGRDLGTAGAGALKPSAPQMPNMRLTHRTWPCVVLWPLGQEGEGDLGMLSCWL